jgi:WD40 repeat protein
MSLRKCSSHLRDVIDEHMDQLWKYALFHHYPQAAASPSKGYLERFAQAHIWRYAKQVPGEFKPQDIGFIGEPQDQLEYTHDHQNSLHKPDLSHISGGKFELVFSQNSKCYSQEIFSCGIIPYERWIPIPNTHLCAHACRPATNHAGNERRRGHRGRQTSYDQVLRVFDKRCPGKGYAPKDGHNNLISDLAIDGETLVTSSLDGSVKVWNILPDEKERVKLVHTLNAHQGWVNGNWLYLSLT